MNSTDYPSMRYAADESPRIVANEQEDLELSSKWLDTYDPEALAAALLASMQEYAGDDAQLGSEPAAETLVTAKKVGRPRKSATPAAE